MCSYASNPLLVIIDVQPKELGIPTKAYYAVEEVKEVHTWNPHLCLMDSLNSQSTGAQYFLLSVLQDATQKSQKAFVHVASEIGAYEAEEIGKFLVLCVLGSILGIFWQ